MIKMIKRRNKQQRKIEILKRKADEQARLEVKDLINKIKFEQECG